VTAPIVGTTTLEQLDAAMASVELTLTPDECAELEAPYHPHAVRGWLDGAVVLTPPQR
jgi:aryl-alcohol dehydrogenase-like predicted oxidoreductase